MLKKEITFIYSDTAEKNCYQPIAQEAEKRGYHVKFTDNKLEKCEIGFYCQHVNFPQYSKFSLIMLHDIIQQYSNWPDIWYNEPWDRYDIGILPSDQWVKNWNQCSQLYYARPRRGMYLMGWPKADVIAQLQARTYREDFYKQYGLDMQKKTVLYAPAWENDGKQDDFVRAMQKLDVNIVIKQADWNGALYPQQVENIQQMRQLHQGLPGVTILPPATNIFEAIAVSDLLVSEESSTMCEAVMMGVPAVSVSDWLIPDTTPSRFPKCDYTFVETTRKAQLTDTVREILENYGVYRQKAQDFSRENFANIGKTASMIMDLIDDCVAGRPIRQAALTPKPNEPVPADRDRARKLRLFKIALVQNYGEKNAVLRGLVSFARKAKHSILG